MSHCLVDVKSSLLSMVVVIFGLNGDNQIQRGSMVCRLLIDEDWWGKIDILFKFTRPAFEILQKVDIDKPFLEDVYDGMVLMRKMFRVKFHMELIK
jgi:hypothetical protein